MKRPSVLLLGWLLITASAAVQARSPPSIANDLTNVTVLVGGTATLSIGVAGTGPFTYQWLFNGAPLNFITTVAGNGAFGFSGDGGSATNAEVNSPSGMAVDGTGNVFIADSQNIRIREVDTNGIITTVAGNGTAGYSGDGGPATNATLYFTAGVAMDRFGNLFIADELNSRIREVFTNGIITTVAGNGVVGYSGDGGIATNAALHYPKGVAVDSIGNVFIADWGNFRIREVGTNGIITTVAGNGVNGYSGDGGSATNAELTSTGGVTVDSAGNLFIGDYGNNRIREVGTNGIITSVAGTNAYGYSGDGGPAINGELWYPMGVAVDSVGNLFIADYYNNRIREVGTNGIITTVAGNGVSGYSGDGGAATNAELRNPSGVAVDSIGDLFIADEYNNRIREVDTNGIIATVAGNGGGGYSGDGGYATCAALSWPSGVAVDSLGNLFIADSENNRIRKVTEPSDPTLLLNNVNASNAGSYSVVVSSL
jgi:hypothetical protein